MAPNAVAEQKKVHAAAQAIKRNGSLSSAAVPRSSPHWQHLPDTGWSIILRHRRVVELPTGSD